MSLLLHQPRPFAKNKFSPFEALGFGASGKTVTSAFDKQLPLFWNLLDPLPHPSPLPQPCQLLLTHSRLRPTAPSSPARP